MTENACPEGDTTEDSHRLSIAVHPDDLDEIKALAISQGVGLEIVESRGFEPVTAVTVVVFGTYTALAVVQQMVDERKGGQVIDLRPGAPRREYRAKGVKYGLVVIYAADGSVTVTVKEPIGVFGNVVATLREMTAGLGKAGIQVLAQTARAALKDAADIETQLGDHPDDRRDVQGGD